MGNIRGENVPGDCWDHSEGHFFRPNTRDVRRSCPIFAFKLYQPYIFAANLSTIVQYITTSWIDSPACQKHALCMYAVIYKLGPLLRCQIPTSLAQYQIYGMNNRY